MSHRPTSRLPNPHSRPFLLAVRSIQQVPRRTRTVRAGMTILLPRNNERGDVIEALEGGRVERGVPAGLPRRLVQGSRAVDRRVVGRLHDRLAAEQTPDVGGRRRAQEISYPFNRKKLTADGAVYATGDVELFVLLGDASDPRFNEYRVRAGVGYRRDFSWRFEALFVQTRQRSGDSGFSTSSNAFDARVTRVF
jgi:hypothetical protein